MQKTLESLGITDDVMQTTAELAGWVFFLVMLGELVWSDSQKGQILEFYGISEV